MTHEAGHAAQHRDPAGQRAGRHSRGHSVAERESTYSWQIARLDNPWMWAALLAIATGLGFMAWTLSLFRRIGDGTHAPWEPTQNLVAVGPYRHLRNPMIGGAITVLLGEALLFGSLPLLGWAVVFAAANALYMPLVEEPGLERRFGEDYRRYKANVPPWVPRLTAWRDPERGPRDEPDAT